MKWMNWGRHTKERLLRYSFTFWKHITHTHKSIAQPFFHIFLFLSHSSIARMSWRSQVFPHRKTAKYPLSTFPILIKTYTRTHTKIHIRTRKCTLSLCFIIKISRILWQLFLICDCVPYLRSLKYWNPKIQPTTQKRRRRSWWFGTTLLLFRIFF